MRVVLTGGAGFLGSHVSAALVARGDAVVCVDDLSTGNFQNIAQFRSSPLFTFVRADVSEGLPVAGPVDAVAHLASPASPPDYHRLPLETLAVGSRGTDHCLQLAERHGARFVLASTSEIYGDPLVHPQVESYWGNVNTVGPRSVYDEAKRFAETITTTYRRRRNVNTGIVRIFNTFGPQMRPRDGRVVSSFIVQALNGDPLTIYGDGSQTRSFCYVDDLVRAILAMIDSPESGPINIGNPTENTVLELATEVLRITGSQSEIQFFPLPRDDPTRRRPDITKATELLRWAPEVTLRDGLRRTVAYFQAHREEVFAAAPILAGPQFEGELTMQDAQLGGPGGGGDRVSV